jgi:predicted RNA-binding protein with PIN domain
MTEATPRTVVVDGNNVMGATPDGWWRDRPAAVTRLLARLKCYVRATDDDLVLVLVLDAPQADLPEGERDGVIVQYARRRGRDAADDRIRELLGEREVDLVVTSDRALADDVRAAGVEVLGARSLLSRVEAAGC